MQCYHQHISTDQNTLSMAVKITCIKKANGDHENPYVAIKSMRWINEDSGAHGVTTREMMYDFIREGGIAYVLHGTGHRAELEARISPGGTKYVKTRSNETTADNLLRLPECL